VKAQRLRLTYARGEPVKDLSHLETTRALERALADAGLPLAYSEGKRKTPQISIAAPLPVGVTSSCEAADVYLAERLSPAAFLGALRGTMPAGLEPVSAREVGLAAPAAQVQVRWAEYEVDVPAAGKTLDDARHAISELMAAKTLPWEHRRETKVSAYDLRPLVLTLALETEGEGAFRLRMRLRILPERSGRADQVVAALGLGTPLRVHRTRLYFDETPAAVRAYRLRSDRED
jgi:radical SAM-linked protein